ncbi:MAG: AAA family ATPase [Acidobacteriota bacterium]
MSSDKQISPEELRKFLQNKLGSGVQVDLFAQPQTEEVDEETARTEARNKALEFNYKPSDIKRYLDRFVIRQDDAKKVLATAICDHYHHLQNLKGPENWLEYKKQNIILIGPTGVGKTYLVQNIARLIGVPFAKADATKFSETGYVGGDVEDLVRELVAQANGDVALAECGIIYLDEIDKIAASMNMMGRDVSGRGVQRNLLKLMEETEVPLRSATDIASQMQAFIEFQTKGRVEKKTINTGHILFIVSGAFQGLTDIIKKRIGSKQIGFTGEKLSVDEEHGLYERVRAVDFIEYGFEAEFAGRLPVVVHCQPLSVDDLFDVAKHSEGSILKQYREDFRAYGCPSVRRSSASSSIICRTVKSGSSSSAGNWRKTLRDASSNCSRIRSSTALRCSSGRLAESKRRSEKSIPSSSHSHRRPPSCWPIRPRSRAPLSWTIAARS